MLMLPAPAQGALAVECRGDDADLVELLALPRRSSTPGPRSTAERALLATLGGRLLSARSPALADVAEDDDGDWDLSARCGVQPGWPLWPSGCPVPERSPTRRTSAGSARRRSARRRCRHRTGEYQHDPHPQDRRPDQLRRGWSRRPGPADPARDTTRCAAADHVVYDRGVPETLLAAIREMTPEEAEFSPAEGAPGDVAKVLLSAARSGLRAVHLVAGDPFGHDVGGQGGPGGRPDRGAVRGRARRRPGRRRGHLRRRAADRRAHHGRRRRRQQRSTSRRSPRPPSRGSSPLALDAGDLAAVRDGLLAAGVDAATAGRGDRRRHRRDAVHHDLHGGQLRRRGARLHRPGRADRRRRRQPTGTSSSWWENRPLYGWKVLVPRTKEQAGAMSERLRAYGAIPCEVPTIAVEPPRTPAQMERAIKGLVDGRYAWVDLHLGERGPRGLGEVRRARSRRPPLRRRQDRLHRRGDRRGGARLRHPARADPGRRAARPRACSPSSRRTTRSSTRSAGCCCRGPTSPPRRWPPG